MSIAKILTNKVLTVVVDGQEPFTISVTNDRFQLLLDAVDTGDEHEVRKVINVIESLREYVKSSEGIEIMGGKVYFNGECLENGLTDRIISCMDQQIEFSHLMNFLDNLMENPSYQSREELYGFLEACRLPITEDGRFIAYKAVNNDFTDKHSGKFDNSPGEVCSMPRRAVNDDCNQTCSSGLHVMSLGYMGECGFGTGSDTVVAVAINPRDVVSVPIDYNNSKMRVCEYEVLQVVTNPHEKFADAMVDQDELSEYFDEDECCGNGCDGCGCGG